MGRRNRVGGHGELKATTVRLSATDRIALEVLGRAWGLDAQGDVLRRALLEAAERVRDRPLSSRDPRAPEEEDSGS